MSHSSYEGFTADFADSLEQLAQRALNLQEVARGIQEAAPERTEGTDPTGAVRVVVGSDGLPESIRADDRWQTRISAEALGSAVTEASQESVRRRANAWSRILERTGSGQSGPAGTRPAPMPGADGPEASAERSLSEIAEEAIGSFDAAVATPPRGAVAAQARGANRERTVSLMLTDSGQLSCTVDAQWAAKQSAERLNQALKAALASAGDALRNQGR